MSINVTATQIVTYQNNVKLALQQKKTKLANHAMPFAAKGKRCEIDNLIGSVLPTENGTRHGDTQYVDTPHDRRWLVKPSSPFEYADLVDEEDRYRTGIDLQGSYTMACAATMARSADIAFLRGYYGNAYTGEDGGTIVTFPGANVGAVDIGAASATGLNIAKLRWARKRLQKNLVDIEEEELLCAITAEQSDNLLNEWKATSTEFVGSEKAVLKDGKLTKLLGFNFIECEYGSSTSFGSAAALTLDGSGYRRVMAWAKSGMTLGEWGSMQTSIDRLPHKRNSVQVYGRRDLAASRNEEGKCLQILCNEA